MIRSTTVISCGSGDIGFYPCTMKDTGIPSLCVEELDRKLPIDTSIKPEEYTKPGSSFVLFQFEKPESIDVLIEMLEEVKTYFEEEKADA